MRIRHYFASLAPPASDLPGEEEESPRKKEVRDHDGDHDDGVDHNDHDDGGDHHDGGDHDDGDNDVVNDYDGEDSD